MAATTVRRTSTPGTAEGAPTRFDARLSAAEDVELRPLPKPTRRTNDDFLDEQFVVPPPKFPYRAVVMATIMFVLGSVLIVIGSLLMVGIIGPATETDPRTIPMLFLGAILFIPGFYHVRIAYYAYKGYPGYDWSQLPVMDDD